MRQDSEAGKNVNEINSRYENLLKVKIGNDNYVPVSVQTVDNVAMLRKPKYAQTGAVDYVGVGVQWQAEAVIEAQAEAAVAEAAPDMLREATAKVCHTCISGTVLSCCLRKLHRHVYMKVSFIPAAAVDAGVGAPAPFRSKLGGSSMTDNASLRYSSSMREPGSQGGIPAVHVLMVSNIEKDADSSQV